MKNRAFRQIFRQTVEQFSDQKLTGKAASKNGHAFHDFALNLLARFTHESVLSQDHVHMLNNVLPRTWGLFRFGDDLGEVLHDVRTKVLKLLEDEQAKPAGGRAIEGLHKYMKPPYPITWIERPHNKDSNITICYLIESEPKKEIHSVFDAPSLRFIQFVHDRRDGKITPLPGVTYIGPDRNPFDLHLDVSAYKRSERAQAIDTIASSGNAIMAALLLLNCRSPVFKYHPDPIAKQANNISRDNHEEFELSLIRENRRHRAPSVIEFDLTRMMRHHGANENSAHRDMLMHLVRGHFKLRKSGVWYWSHHMRGNIAPEGTHAESTPKAYGVVRKTDGAFGLPGGATLG